MSYACKVGMSTFSFIWLCLFRGRLVIRLVGDNRKSQSLFFRWFDLWQLVRRPLAHCLARLSAVKHIYWWANEWLFLLCTWRFSFSHLPKHINLVSSGRSRSFYLVMLEKHFVFRLHTRTKDCFLFIDDGFPAGDYISNTWFCRLLLPHLAQARSAEWGGT